MSDTSDSHFPILTRRHLLTAGAVSVAGLALAACSSSTGRQHTTATTSAAPTDFSKRFARYTADSSSPDSISIPATFLRVTVTR